MYLKKEGMKEEVSGASTSMKDLGWTLREALPGDQVPPLRRAWKPLTVTLDKISEKENMDKLWHLSLIISSKIWCWDVLPLAGVRADRGWFSKGLGAGLCASSAKKLMLPCAHTTTASQEKLPPRRHMTCATQMPTLALQGCSGGGSPTSKS